MNEYMQERLLEEEKLKLVCILSLFFVLDSLDDISSDFCI